MKVLAPHPKKPMPWLMGKDWPSFWRVRLPRNILTKEKVEWCKDNVAPENWSKTFGDEVFYFVNVEDAAAFKLRWEGATK